MQDFIDADACSPSVSRYIIIPRQDAPLPRTSLASLVAQIMSNPQVSLISVIGSTDNPFALVVEMSEARFEEMTRQYGEQFVISRDERVPEPPRIGPA